MVPVHQALNAALRRVRGHDVRVAAAATVIAEFVPPGCVWDVSERVVDAIERRERDWANLTRRVPAMPDGGG